MSNDHVHPTFQPILAKVSPKVDPREPDHSRQGIFRDHNCWRCGCAVVRVCACRYCWRCHDGAKACAQGGPHRCEYPHARND